MGVFKIELATVDIIRKQKLQYLIRRLRSLG